MCLSIFQWVETHTLRIPFTLVINCIHTFSAFSVSLLIVVVTCSHFFIIDNFPPWKNWKTAKPFVIVAFILILVRCIGYHFFHHRSHPRSQSFLSYLRFPQIHRVLFNNLICSLLFWTHIFVQFRLAVVFVQFVLIVSCVTFNNHYIHIDYMFV
jgi:hypothetical protein